MTPEKSIDVAIIEDDGDMRSTLQEIVDLTPDLTCTGSFGTCEEALACLADDRPDVILMDINLPGMSGIEGVRRIKALYPGVEILMQTVYSDDDNIFRSICAGASGYLLKRTPREALVNAIREVHAGGAPMNAGIARRVLHLFQRTAGPSPGESTLTRREVEILHALVEGGSYKMIADRHFISIETVRNHIKHIYEKLHVHSKSEAVAKALRERLV
jgi:DNA-binding NarL/FixJ family response regulator